MQGGFLFQNGGNVKRLQGVARKVDSEELILEPDAYYLVNPAQWANLATTIRARLGAFTILRSGAWSTGAWRTTSKARRARSATPCSPSYLRAVFQRGNNLPGKTPSSIQTSWRVRPIPIATVRPFGWTLNGPPS